MLVLSRKTSERIIIDLAEHGLGLVTITMLEAYDGTAKIGIDAHRDIPIDREEIYKQVQRNGRKKKRG